jgi:hypothetical protein
MNRYFDSWQSKFVTNQLDQTDESRNGHLRHQDELERKVFSVAWAPLKFKYSENTTIKPAYSS